MRASEFVLGALIVLVMFFDIFQSIVLPRPTPVALRPGGGLVWGLWYLCRVVATRLRSPNLRDLVLGTFASLAVVALLLCWVAGLIVGYGLMLDALPMEEQPAITNLGSALYFSGVSLLTLGFGDIVATGGAARALVLTEATSGLATMALAITFLFTLFGAYQRREVLVVRLSARAGAPPSGVNLLEAYARLEMLQDLSVLFEQWETWAAEVLDSHLSYPILAFFRSTHDRQSWISALGAVLDAAALVVTTVDGQPRGAATMLLKVGTHLVEDLAQYFRLQPAFVPYVERWEFDEARLRLAAVGYGLRDAEAAWAAFVKWRTDYAGALNLMCALWVTPPAQWMGDRSYVRPHRQRQLVAK